MRRRRLAGERASGRACRPTRTPFTTRSCLVHSTAWTPGPSSPTLGPVRAAQGGGPSHGGDLCGPHDDRPGGGRGPGPAVRLHQRLPRRRQLRVHRRRHASASRQVGRLVLGVLQLRRGLHRRHGGGQHRREDGGGRTRHGIAVVFGTLFAAIAWNCATWWLDARRPRAMRSSAASSARASPPAGRTPSAGPAWRKTAIAIVLSPLVAFFIAFHRDVPHRGDPQGHRRPRERQAVQVAAAGLGRRGVRSATVPTTPRRPWASSPRCSSVPATWPPARTATSPYRCGSSSPRRCHRLRHHLGRLEDHRDQVEIADRRNKRLLASGEPFFASASRLASRRFDRIEPRELRRIRIDGGAQRAKACRKGAFFPTLPKARVTPNLPWPRPAGTRRAPSSARVLRC